MIDDINFQNHCHLLNVVSLQELEDRKRITSGLQVQTIVGEENNDLLDYLRSLAPDKVGILYFCLSEYFTQVEMYILFCIKSQWLISMFSIHDALFDR